MFPLLFLIACAPFEGTWAFSIDAEPVYGGDCAEDAQNSSDVSSNTVTLVDIYALANGEWVVFLGQAMTGEANLESISVEWTEDLEYSDETEHDSSALTATGDAASIAGNWTVSYWQEAASGDDYTCSQDYGFTATRIVSSRDRYASSP